MTMSTVSNPVESAKRPAREPLVLSRGIQLTVLFMFIFLAVRVSLQRIDYTDYETNRAGFTALLHGENAYQVSGFLEPPWSAYLLFPIVQQPVETWLALDVALFVVFALDLGKPSALLLIGNPIFIFLIVSSNPEWLFIGPGLWLLYRRKRGWWRGLAWLFLICKPQTMFFVLLLDGWKALRQRDWRAFALTGVVGVVSLLSYPQIMSRAAPLLQHWASSVLPTYGIGITIAVTILLLLFRWGRLRDLRTIAILLAPIWSPYFLEYSAVAAVFTMRSAGWIRNIVFLVGSFWIGLYTFEQYHVAEAAGVAGITLLAALLAPAYAS